MEFVFIDLIKKYVVFILFVLGSHQVLGQTILIGSGSEWKYSDTGTNQGTDWREQGFNDSNWKTGPAQFGYGDGDESTVISYGPSSSNKIRTYYFRHSFNVTDPTQYLSLILELLRDDGAVVYLNGIEIERSNMTSGTINYLTFAAHTVSGSEEDMFIESLEDPVILVAGINVLAVEVHQRSASSSDLSFDLRLSGSNEMPDLMRKSSYIIYKGNNSGMEVLWQLISTEFCTIEWGTDTLYNLGNEQTTEYGDDHQHYYTFTGLTPGTKYYYKVTAANENYIGSFWTAPNDNATQIKFLAYGDTRSYPETHDWVASAITEAYLEDQAYQSLILQVGDLVSDGDTESSWDTQFFDSNFPGIRKMFSELPYQSCMGNHEGLGELFQKYFPYPFLNGRYWSFDYGPAHFTIVDQYTSYSPGSVQFNWFENDLATSNKIWKFVVLHEPGWSAGGHSNEVPVQTHIQPLLKKHGVSILFAGHNHYYARAEVEGVQHVTTGGGGAPLYAPIPTYPNLISTAELNHFCKIDITDNTLSFSAVTPDGDIFDSFTTTSPLVAISHIEDPQLPKEFELFPAYPNPFNPNTTISFSIPASSLVKLKIYNSQGQIIRNLVEENLNAGHHKYLWNGKNNAGQIVSSGIYFCKLKNGNKTKTGKIMFIK